MTFNKNLNFKPYVKKLYQKLYPGISYFELNRNFSSEFGKRV